MYLVVGHAVGRHLFDSAAIAGATLWIALFIPLTAFRLLIPEALRGFSDIKWATILGDAATNVTLAVALAVIVAGGWTTSLTQVLVISIALAAVLLVLSTVSCAPGYGRSESIRPVPERSSASRCPCSRPT